VIPFGLCNAPFTFQAAMNAIFRPYLRKFILVFFDDILINSSDWDTHLIHIKRNFKILASQHFVVKPSKCVFGQTEVDYLGNLITVAGMKVDPHKIAAMQSWPQPKTITELWGFLGLTGYYQKFVKLYGIIARQSTQLLKKGQFEWGPNAETSFIALNHAMTTTPVLGYLAFLEFLF